MFTIANKSIDSGTTIPNSMVKNACPNQDYRTTLCLTIGWIINPKNIKVGIANPNNAVPSL
ncbi:MAG: hypothetical protein WCJ61_10870 [Paludibacter sp.]